MARIIGGIGASHTPTIGFAKDRHTKADAQWTGTFDIFEPVTAWLEEKKPDVLFVIYNDHITSFFFDHYSVFMNNLWLSILGRTVFVKVHVAAFDSDFLQVS